VGVLVALVRLGGGLARALAVESDLGKGTFDIFPDEGDEGGGGGRGRRAWLLRQQPAGQLAADGKGGAGGFEGMSRAEQSARRVAEVKAAAAAKRLEEALAHDAALGLIGPNGGLSKRRKKFALGAK
jgi:hypothetical protein